MASSSWMQSLINPRRNFLAAMHRNAVSKRLKNYGIDFELILDFFLLFRVLKFWWWILVVGRLGLRYDDLFDPMEDLDIKEALARLPREIVDARNQRLKRAMDLSMKHEYLPKDLQVKCLDSIPYSFWLIAKSCCALWSDTGNSHVKVWILAWFVISISCPQYCCVIRLKVPISIIVFDRNPLVVIIEMKSEDIGYCWPILLVIT